MGFNDCCSRYFHNECVILENLFSNMVERVEWDGDKIVMTRNITSHAGNCYRPTLFFTQYDSCKDFCSENFCYN